MGLCLAIAGCSGGKDAGAPAPTPAATPAAAPADGGVDATASATAPSDPLLNGLMTVEPAAMSGCPDVAPIVADVKWAITDPTVATVKLEVGPMGQPHQLMAEAGATDSAKTGPWVVPGTEFVLRDGATGRELSKAVVGSGACAPPAG
jgi:hypothetical protein